MVNVPGCRRIISVFDRISVDGKVTQHRVRRYLMLNKPPVW